MRYPSFNEMLELLFACNGSFSIWSLVESQMERLEWVSTDDGVIDNGSISKNLGMLYTTEKQTIIATAVLEE